MPAAERSGGWPLLSPESGGWGKGAGGGKAEKDAKISGPSVKEAEADRGNSDGNLPQ